MPRRRNRTRDWLFGAAGKRRLLGAVLAQPDRIWTQAELARAGGLTPKGAVDEHVMALVAIGLLTQGGDGYRLNSSSRLGTPLRRVLAALDALPDAELPRPGHPGI